MADVMTVGKEADIQAAKEWEAVIDDGGDIQDARASYAATYTKVVKAAMDEEGRDNI